jgi:hypothetical protein
VGTPRGLARVERRPARAGRLVTGERLRSAPAPLVSRRRRGRGGGREHLLDRALHVLHRRRSQHDRGDGARPERGRPGARGRRGPAPDRPLRVHRRPARWRPRAGHRAHRRGPGDRAAARAGRSRRRRAARGAAQAARRDRRRADRAGCCSAASPGGSSAGPSRSAPTVSSVSRSWCRSPISWAG